MRKIGLFRANLLRKQQRLIQRKVRDMAFGLQRVDIQCFSALYFCDFRRGDGFGIGNIGEIVDAEAQHRQLVMHHLDRGKMDASDIKRFKIDSMQVYLRYTWIFKLGKNISELTPQGRLYPLGSININRRLLEIIERAYVIPT